MSSQAPQSTPLPLKEPPEAGSNLGCSPQPPSNQSSIAPPFPPPPPPLACDPQVQQTYLCHLTTWQQWAQNQQQLPTPPGVSSPTIFAPTWPLMYSFGSLPLRPGNRGLNVQAQPFVPRASSVPGAFDNKKQLSKDEPPIETNAPHPTLTNAQETRKMKSGEPKIMMPAPTPRPEYLTQAKGEPHVVTPPDQKLVILDLNGTLLYRPNRKNPTRMIGRPFLGEFLKYLFSNFAVMVWSSARPQNVKVLVENGLGDFRHKLVGRWARNSFGLSEQHYNQNVQVYKNLELVWASGDIQRKMEGYEQGKRFDQRNTILIDDSLLKAAAQPFNLLEIPEFLGEPTQQDVLSEVAGYLELLKMQEDVSKYIYQTMFKADGTWATKWSDLLPADVVPQSEPESNALAPVVIGG